MLKGSSDSKKSNWFAYDAMEFLTYNILGIQNVSSLYLFINYLKKKKISNISIINID